jgi:hypothetical protein
MVKLTEGEILLRQYGGGKFKNECHRFPDCVCGSIWAHWQIRMTEMWEDNPPSQGEIDVAEMTIYDMLRCIRDCNVDPAMRWNAQRQLSYPAFDRQHHLLRERIAKWHQQ